MRAALAVLALAAWAVVPTSGARIGLSDVAVAQGLWTPRGRLDASGVQSAPGEAAEEAGPQEVAHDDALAAAALLRAVAVAIPDLRQREKIVSGGSYGACEGWSWICLTLLAADSGSNKQQIQATAGDKVAGEIEFTYMSHSEVAYDFATDWNARPTFGDPLWVYISWMEVSPEFRGMGIATWLSYAALWVAARANVTVAWLVVEGAESNVEATELYHKFGFRRLTDGEFALVRRNKGLSPLVRIHRGVQAFLRQELFHRLLGTTAEGDPNEQFLALKDEMFVCVDRMRPTRRLMVCP